MQVRIDNALLDSLTEQAKGSARLRMSYDWEGYSGNNFM